MKFTRTGFAFSLVVFALFLAAGPACAEDFKSIMTSISKVGALDNGDGHEWTFRKSGDGWEVEGANFETAEVTSAGANKVSIDGFPDRWGANGIYVFSKKSGACVLDSQESATHRLEWKCSNLTHDSQEDSTPRVVSKAKPAPEKAVVVEKPHPSGMDRRVVSKEKPAPDNAVITEMPRPEGLGRRGRKRWRRYLKARSHKAFARGPGKRYGWSSGRSSVEKAKRAAIRRCEKKGDTCRLVSVDGGPVDQTR